MKEIVIEREVRIGKDSTAPVPMSAATRRADRVDEGSIEVPIPFAAIGAVGGIVMMIVILLLVAAN